MNQQCLGKGVDARVAEMRPGIREPVSVMIGTVRSVKADPADRSPHTQTDQHAFGYGAKPG